jgi:hypothetical protein
METLMSSSPFPGPIAPESNPPINPQYYEPSRFAIENITLGTTTLVETTVDHNYVIGQLVRTLIPFGYGTTQLNGQQGYVISIPAANEVVINIDSTNYTAFSGSFTRNLTQPQIIAIGDVNSGVPSNSNGRVLNGTAIPGSFINISPA